MTKKIFEKILNENNIIWNNMVTLTVVNPKYVKSIFNWSRQPKVLRFYGALGYHKNDDNVSLMVRNRDIGITDGYDTDCTDLHFSFDEIVGIKKNNYETLDSK